jgi:hypothetical protein
MEKNTLHVFSDIHGDFDALVHLLTNVIKVADFKENIWKWKAVNTTVVCLGDFVDRYRVKNEYEVSTKDAIEGEIKIITCFKALQSQVTDNCAFIVLLGNHEIECILQDPDFFQYGMQHPNDPLEQKMRKLFIREHLLEFAETCGIICQWSDIIMCHGGLEMAWLTRHKFQSIEQINKRFTQILQSHRQDRLEIFSESDSILMSRKMALQPDEWRQMDKPQIIQLFGPILNPKFVVGHTTVSDINRSSLSEYYPPQCDRTNHPTSILASRDYFGKDDMYFVDIAMSRGFYPVNATDKDKIYQRPQALSFELTSNENMDLFLKCKTT